MGEDSLQGKMSMPAVEEESRSVKYVPGRDQEIEYVVKLDPQSGEWQSLPRFAGGGSAMQFRLQDSTPASQR